MHQSSTVSEKGDFDEGRQSGYEEKVDNSCTLLESEMKMLNEPLGNLEVFDVLDLDAGTGDRILTIGHHPSLIQETYCVDKKNATIYTE